MASSLSRASSREGSAAGTGSRTLLEILGLVRAGGEGDLGEATRDGEGALEAVRGGLLVTEAWRGE